MMSTVHEEKAGKETHCRNPTWVASLGAHSCTNLQSDLPTQKELADGLRRSGQRVSAQPAGHAPWWQEAMQGGLTSLVRGNLQAIGNRVREQ